MTVAASFVNMARPRVSVLVPAYNAASTLQETIDSVRQQDFLDWELLIVDDGSTDATAELVGACTDARIRLIRQANAGLAGARNRGCTEARGEYLAVLDADDLARPDRLALQVAFLDAHPEVDLCFTAFEAFDANGPIPGPFASEYYPVLQRDDYRWERLFETAASWTPGEGGAPLRVFIGAPYRQLAHGNFVHPPTLMLRRCFWQTVGSFDTRIRNLTDWEWLVRAARVGRFAYLDRVGIDYRRHAAQMSGPAHTERLARDLVQVNECICQADPALYELDRARFDADLCQFHWTLANVLANKRGADAVASLRKSLAYGWPGSSRVGFVLAKAAVPRPLLDLAKHLLGRVRAQRA